MTVDYHDRRLLLVLRRRKARTIIAGHLDLPTHPHFTLHIARTRMS